MGNLSNPVINRLGINTFWNTIWFTNYKYSVFFQQYNIISYLIFIIIYYGIYNYHLFFINKYWFFSYFLDYKKKLLHSFLYYYRYQLLKNKYNNADISYLIRIKRLIVYPMRLWVLRYQNWLVINWFIFQPLNLVTNENYMGAQLDVFPQLEKNFFFLRRFYYLLYTYYLSEKQPFFYYNF